MANRNYSSIALKSKVLENTGHSGTKSETFGRGMQYVFEKPKLKLDDFTLNQYSGKYQLPDGSNIELKNENNHLVFYFSPTFRYDLFAASQNEFYSTTEFFNINFRAHRGSVEGLDLARYNNTQFLKKVN